MKKKSALIFVLLCLCLCGCGKSRAVRQAEEKIASIGFVSVDSGPAIEEAEAALNALSLKEREKVENAAELSSAREAWRNAVAAQEEQQRQERLAALREALVGNWEFTQDATALYAELIDRIIGTMLGPTELRFADYVDTISATGTFSLLQNGTYKIGLTRAQQEQFVDSVMEPVSRYYADLLRYLTAQALMPEGIYIEDIHSDEAWIAATGMDFNTLITADLGMGLDAFIDYLLQMMRDPLLEIMNSNAEKMGNYQIEEGRMLLSDRLEDAVSDTRYVSFSFESGELRLTGYTNVPDFGNVFPVVMKKTA